MLELPRGVTRAARKKIKYQIVSMSNMRDAGHTFVSKVQHRLSCEATDQYVSAIVAGSRNSLSGFSFGNQARVRGLCARCGAGVFRNIPSKTLATFGSGQGSRAGRRLVDDAVDDDVEDVDALRAIRLGERLRQRAGACAGTDRSVRLASNFRRDVQDTCCGDAAAKRII